MCGHGSPDVRLACTRTVVALTGAPASLAFNSTLRASIAQRLSQRTRRRAAASSLKRAAVTVLLTDDGGGMAALVLTLRPEHMKNHASQYALPGGRLDHGETEVTAALREMREEIGLDLNAEFILGALDDYTTRSGFLITPLVAWAPADASFTPNPDEVAAVYRVPLAELALPGSPEFITIPQSERPVIRYPLLGTMIHAPTAAVMYQFMEIAIHGRNTPVDHLEQPVFAWV